MRAPSRGHLVHYLFTFYSTCKPPAGSRALAGGPARDLQNGQQAQVKALARMVIFLFVSRTWRPPHGCATAF
jgi:hypothetical protein